MNRSIIVTGGSGYIGSAVIDKALKSGYKVYNLDLVPPEYVPKSDNYHYLQCDLSNCDKIIELLYLLPKKVYGVIHMAAWKDLIESYNSPLEYYRNNLISTINVLRIATSLECKRFIFSSSAAVYSDDLIGVVSETDKATGDSPYGYSKLVAERLITDTCKRAGINSFNLRYQNPIGGIEGVTIDDTTTMFGSVLLSIRDEFEFTIFGDDHNTPDGTCIRDYIDIRDIANIHIKFLDYKIKGKIINDTINVGRGEGLSCLEACNIVKELYPDFKFKIGKSRGGDSDGGYADTTKLNEKYKIFTEYNIKDTIKNIINIALSQKINV